MWASHERLNKHSREIQHLPSSQSYSFEDQTVMSPKAWGAGIAIRLWQSTVQKYCTSWNNIWEGSSKLKISIRELQLWKKVRWIWRLRAFACWAFFFLLWVCFRCGFWSETIKYRLEHCWVFSSSYI